MSQRMASISTFCAFALLLTGTGCKWHFADASNFSRSETPGIGASLAYSSDSRVALRYLPKQERWDPKVIGTLGLEQTGLASKQAPLEIRRIHRGYALEQTLHENDVGQRWLFTTSYGREYDGMVGVSMRWNF